jgi:hypothetical protein
VRAFARMLAFGLLVLAGSAWVLPASACERPMAAAAKLSEGTPISLSLRRLPAPAVVQASHDELASPDHHHPGSHPHQHGCPDGCCAVCCAAGAAHGLMPQSDVLRPGPAAPALPLADPVGVTKADAGGPFRPPRSA